MQKVLAESWTPSEADVMDLPSRLDDGTSPHIEQDVTLCIESGSRRMGNDALERLSISREEIASRSQSVSGCTPQGRLAPPASAARVMW